jgi:hypothetical protein
MRPDASRPSGTRRHRGLGAAGSAYRLGGTHTAPSPATPQGSGYKYYGHYRSKAQSKDLSNYASTCKSTAVSRPPPMALLNFIVVCLLLATIGQCAQPCVHVKNGTYCGLYDSTFDQDLFLGIPYAIPPTGTNRLTQPQSLNTTWNNSRSVTQYGFDCPQFLPLLDDLMG